MLVRRLLLGCLIAALSSAIGARHVAAEQVRADGAKPPAGYTELIDEAVEEAGKAHFEEARALFARAHALYPNARTLRGLGIMAYELRSYVESIAFHEQALASKERPLNEALRSEALSVIERARRFVAEVTLAIAPPETRVLLDGKAVTLPDSRLVRLDRGTHTLRFEAAGYRSETRSLEVRGGERLSWNVALSLVEPMPSAQSATQGAAVAGVSLSSAEDPRRDEPPKKKPLYKNPWLWTGVALAAAGVAVGVAFALKDEPKSVQESPITSNQTPPEGVVVTLGRSR